MYAGRDECFYISRSKTNPTSDTVRFALRFILKMRSGGDRMADIVPGKDGGSKRRFRHGPFQLGLINSDHVRVVVTFV